MHNPLTVCLGVTEEMKWNGKLKRRGQMDSNGILNSTGNRKDWKRKLTSSLCCLDVRMERKGKDRKMIISCVEVFMEEWKRI